MVGLGHEAETGKECLFIHNFLSHLSRVLEEGGQKGEDGFIRLDIFQIELPLVVSANAYPSFRQSHVKA